MKKKERKKERGFVETSCTTPINSSNRLKEWLKRDFFYICLLLFALFACLLTINNSLVMQNECNERWEQQLRDRNIILDPINMSDPYPNIDLINANINNPITNIKS